MTFDLKTLRLLILFYERKDVARFIDRPTLMPRPTFRGLADWLDELASDPVAMAQAVRDATDMWGGDEAVLARQEAVDGRMM